MLSISSSTSHSGGMSCNLGCVQLLAVLHFLNGLLQQAVSPSQVTHEGDVSLLGWKGVGRLSGGRLASRMHRKIGLI